MTSFGGALLGKSLGDGVGEKSDGNFHGYNLAFFDVVGDHGTVLGARTLLFSAEEVTSGKVDKAVILNETSTLCTLARTGPPRTKTTVTLEASKRGVSLCSVAAAAPADVRARDRSMRWQELQPW